MKKKAKRELKKEAKLMAEKLKSDRSETKVLDTNANETPSVVFNEETRACACDTEENNVVDEDLPEFEVEQEPNNIKQEFIEKADQITAGFEETEEKLKTPNKIIEVCDEILAFRTITEAVCEDLRKQFSSAYDTSIDNY